MISLWTEIAGRPFADGADASKSAAIATLAVWIMTLFIQRTNRRDSLAMHAKLDELRVDQQPRSELVRLEGKSRR